MPEFPLGTIAGVRLYATTSTVVGSVLLSALLSEAAVTRLRASRSEAVVLGVLATLVHWASDIVHHLGHAWVAKRTGYPMVGIRLLAIDGISLYPIDEPALPPNIHIQRALGAPAASLLLSLLALGVAFALRPMGNLPRWVSAFAVLDNLFFMTLGPFLPLGFTEGSTLLRWWGKRTR